MPNKNWAGWGAGSPKGSLDMDAPRPTGSAISLGTNRVVLDVTEVEDAQVARGVLERFARKHGASDERSRALVELANELSLDLVRVSRGGRIEAERVGSFIEVRAVARPPEAATTDRSHPTQEIALAQVEQAAGAPTSFSPDASSSSASSSSWRLDLALANMDGSERTPAEAEQLVLRAWCELD